MSKRKGRAVTLTNSMVEGLLRRKDMLQAFPRMAGVARQMQRSIRGCRCAGKTHKFRDRAVQDIKQLMRSWPKSRKDKLKGLLKADTVRMYVGKKMVEF